MKCCNTVHQIPALSSLSLAFSSPNAFDYPDYAPIPSPSPSSVPLFSQWTIPLHRDELCRVIPALTFSISSTEPSDPSLESAVFQEGVPIRVVRTKEAGALADSTSFGSFLLYSPSGEIVSMQGER